MLVFCQQKIILGHEKVQELTIESTHTIFQNSIFQLYPGAEIVYLRVQCIKKSDIYQNLKPKKQQIRGKESLNLESNISLTHLNSLIY